MNNKQIHALGISGEIKAVEYLTARNFTILFRNFNSAFGEIDIIALKENTIHFVEVKTRASNISTALSSISHKKQLKLYKTAQYFLSHHPEFQNYFTQFDVIAIFKSSNILTLRFLEDAFRINL